MKILYCGWGGSSLTWASMYGESIVYYLRKLGHEVYPIYYRWFIKENPSLKLDDKLIAEAEFNKPDIILLLKCECLNPLTIKLLRAKGHKVVYYSCDDPQLFLRDERCRQLGLNSDYAFTWCSDTADEYKKQGVSSDVIYAGFDPRIWDYDVFVEEDERVKYSADVIFLGSAYRNSPVSRIDMCQAVIGEGFYFKLFGPEDWTKEADLKPYYHGFLDMAKQEGTKAIKCAKTVLNTAWSKGRRTPSIRVFETIGLGTVCVSYKNPEFDLVIPAGKGIVYWNTYPELIEKLNTLLKDDKKRQAIATAGRKYVLDNYTSEIQIKKMMDKIQEFNEKEETI